MHLVFTWIRDHLSTGVTLGSAWIGHHYSHYTLMFLMPILIEAVMLLLFGRKQKSFEKAISKCLQNAVHVSAKNFYFAFGLRCIRII